MILLGLVIVVSTLLQLPSIVIGLLHGLCILLLGKLLRHAKLTKLGWQLLIAYDQAANTATGGDPDETISSRTGKLRASRPWARALSGFLDIFQRDHAKKAIEADEGSNRLVE